MKRIDKETIQLNRSEFKAYAFYLIQPYIAGIAKITATNKHFSNAELKQLADRSEHEFFHIVDLIYEGNPPSELHKLLDKDFLKDMAFDDTLDAAGDD